MRHLKATGIGLLLTVAVSFLIAGPLGPFVLVLVVVCTFGLGIIPVLLVSWLVGLMVLMLWSGVPVAHPEPDIPFLMSYICKARSEGITDAGIEGRMRRAGWGRAEIAEAYHRLGQSV